MIETILLIYLMVNALSDIKKRSINILFSITIFAITGAMNIYNDTEIVSCLIGMLPGVILFCFAWITKQGIGYGDALICIVIGCATGVESIIAIMFVGSVCTSVICIGMVFFKKKGKNDSIPWIPFLLLGYVICIVAKYVD